MLKLYLLISDTLGGYSMQTNSSWGGRFSERVSNLVELYSESVSYDKKLYKMDIMGSKAHAKMLASCGIIADDEAKILCDGLDAVLLEIENGTFEWQMALEDVHMNIETRLTQIVGEVGKKLHTARSRNDQVGLDFRLYVSESMREWSKLLEELIGVYVEQAQKHIDTLLPGCTHFQPAQPVSLAHHLLAYAFMFKRDFERLEQAEKRARISPLGAAALAGTTYAIDPKMVAQELDMYNVFSNSMDAVADRDYALEGLFCASTMAMHLSRFCEELIIWSNPQFAFVRLSDKHTTGSSIMPQKKNPDVAELMRGKTGRVYGNLFNLFTQLKGIPLTYNRDLQEDKEAYFDTDTTISMSLAVMKEMLESATFNKENMEIALAKGFLNATEYADYLVTLGIPFREAHHVTGKTVAYAEQNAKKLEELTLEEFNAEIPENYKNQNVVIDNEVYVVLDYKTAVMRRNQHGGTGFDSIKVQLSELTEFLDKIKKA